MSDDDEANDAAINEVIADMNRAGLGARAIGKQVGLGKDVVLRRLRALDLEVGPPTQKKRVFATPEMVNDYNKGHSIRRVGKNHGNLTYMETWTRLANSGVTFRTRRGTRDD